jgi:membrane-associated phospholipid phosphatase
VRAKTAALASILVCILLPFLNDCARAQTPGASTIGDRLVSDVSHAAKGTLRTLASPFRWQGKDWAKFGVVIAGTAALFLVDEQVNDFFLRNQSETADQIADFGLWYGEPITVVMITGAFYSVGLIGDIDLLRENGVVLTASLLATGAYQTVIKNAAGRARPHVGLGATEFDPLNNTEPYYSFFSGHTMAAISLSHVFARHTGSLPLKVLLYGAGSITGLARMYNADHWFSDVVLGSVVGIVAVNSSATWLAQKKSAGEYAGLQWRLLPSQQGLSLRFEW